MEIKLFTGDTETLRPVVESWQQIVLDNGFGIIADDVDKFLVELGNLATNEDSDLLALYDDDEPVGYLGMQYFISPLGRQRMANEHYFFVIPEKRGMSSIGLMRVAKVLAKERGCTHLIMNASNLASTLHDKVCNVYERLGFSKFETSFITGLG